jgi:hypothetical protein
MKSLVICALLLSLIALSLASEIDVSLSTRITVDTNVSVINSRVWTVVQGIGYVVADGVSVAVAPGFTNVDAMFAGLTISQQCSLGFSWFKSATDLNINNMNSNSITFQSVAAAFGFFSRFWGIIEYLDTNGQIGYQPGDTILSFYSLNLNLLAWKPIRLDSVTLSTGDIVYVVTIQTVDEVFALQVFIAPRPIIADNATIDQDSVKVAIEINYYNYSGASTNPNARIALAVLVGAAEAMSFTSGSVAADVDISSNDATYRGYQHWDLTCHLANSDGSNYHSSSVQSFWEVQFSNISEIQGQYEAGWVVSAVYFSFGINETRPGHIWWDPEMGASVNYGSPNATPASSNSNGLQLAPTVSTVLLALFFTILAKKWKVF